MSIPIEGFSPENMERIYLGEPALVGRQERLPVDILGDKEYAVAKLAAEGLTYEQIATESGRSIATVRNQMHSTYLGLQIASKVGLAGYFPIDPEDPRLQGKTLNQLGQRSLEVVQGLSRALTYGVIAQDMGIGTSTASTYAHNITKNTWTDCHGAVVFTRVANGIRAGYARKISETGKNVTNFLEHFALPHLALHESTIRELFGFEAD